VPFRLNERIEWIPVELAKIGKGRSRTEHLPLSRKQDDAPVRGSKPAGITTRRAVVRFHPYSLCQPLHLNETQGNSGIADIPIRCVGSAPAVGQSPKRGISGRTWSRKSNVPTKPGLPSSIRRIDAGRRVTADSDRGEDKARFASANKTLFLVSFIWIALERGGPQHRPKRSKKFIMESIMGSRFFFGAHL
jgi:hypothetical protein